MYKDILSTHTLASHLTDPGWLILDARFELTDPAWGEVQYHAGHIPGAIYAHLERDLSDEITPQSGRHPIPDVDTLVETLRNWGLKADSQVVVYDQSGGSYAARTWWLLKYLGHDAVAVLDGGYAKWTAENRPTDTLIPRPSRGDFGQYVRGEMLVRADYILSHLDDPDFMLVDARTPARYRGETEPIDSYAGHIPGAINRFHADNLDEEGVFKERAALREEYLRLLSGADGAEAVFYCGSGVTSCHNLLAMQAAGLPLPKLYLGSWSEWIRDTSRPVEPPRK